MMNYYSTITYDLSDIKFTATITKPELFKKNIKSGIIRYLFISKK